MTQELILAIDTSSENLGLCLYIPENGENWCFSETLYRGISDRLHVEINKLFEKAGKTAHDVTHVVVTRGPGSFTGIRVGLAAAMGLAQALNVPVATVTTFAAIAHSHRHENKSLTIWMEAHGDDVYTQTFLQGKPQTKSMCENVHEAATSLNSNSMLCGTGATAVHRQNVVEGVEYIEHKYANPKAVAELGWEEIQKGEKFDLSPLYLKKLHYKKMNEQKKRQAG